MRIGLYIFISKGYNRATDKRRTDMYKLIKKDGNAKRGEFHTVHGVIQTPVFMNVGTVAAIKGAVSTEDLEQIKTQVELSNTYHLHVRSGRSADQRIRRTAQIYGMGQANLNGFRRISGVFFSNLTKD